MSGEAPLEAVKVLTFFEAGYDLKHASALRLLLETAEAPLPARLIELAGEDPREKQKYERSGKSGGERDRAHSHYDDRSSGQHRSQQGDRRAQADRAGSDWGPGKHKKEKKGGVERPEEWKRSQSEKEWKGKKEKVPRLPDDWKRSQSSTPADGSARRRWDGWSHEVRAEALALGGWRTE